MTEQPVDDQDERDLARELQTHTAAGRLNHEEVVTIVKKIVDLGYTLAKPSVEEAR